MKQYFLIWSNHSMFGNGAQ